MEARENLQLRNLDKCNKGKKGKTLGLVGLGQIARALAGKIKGFELRILAYDPFGEVLNIIGEVRVKKQENFVTTEDTDYHQIRN